MLIKRLGAAALAALVVLLGQHADAGVVRVNLFVDVHDAATGTVIARQATHNLVVDAGLNLIRDLLDGDASAGITHFGVGTGATAVSVSQTALVAEVEREAVTERVSADKTLTVKYYLGSGVANDSTLAEVGLFNAAAAGTMFARALLSPTIAKTASIAITFTWQITFAAA